MDATLVTVIAAGLGSVIGAAASITTTWLTQRNQDLRASAEWRQRERETLFKEFIIEASRLAVDAVMHSMEGPDSIMKLYDVLSCIRLVSGQDVLRQGEACCRRIVEQYGLPNLTTEQLRGVVAANRVDELDPLEAFSSACRNELLAGQR